VTKRQRIEEYLNWLGPEELRNITVRELTTELAGQGLEVTERYVKQILDQHRPPPSHSGGGGAAPASPADDQSRAAPAGQQGPPAPGAAA
jgi:hypothetical protein